MACRNPLSQLLLSEGEPKPGTAAPQSSQQATESSSDGGPDSLEQPVAPGQDLGSLREKAPQVCSDMR